MKRKIYCILNVLFFLTLSITGCGNPKSDGQPQEADSLKENIQQTETDNQEAAMERPLLILDQFLIDGETLDIAKLQYWNEECSGWLDIPGTNISFPVVQPAEDLAFYLNHNFFKDEDENGCVYTEYYNSADFSDPHTVLYGRNTEEMFTRLHQYQDREFFDEYREIRIYRADCVLTYQIFAAYTYDDRHLIMTYDCWDKNVFTSYLSDVLAQRQMDAFIDTSVEITAQDHIITLSTGVTGQDDKRYLVQAVLVTE